MSTSNQILSGAALVSRLSPMKRILCICPVLSRDYGDKLPQEGYERYKIGMAVSDPYLAHAIPIDANGPTGDKINGLYVWKGLGASNMKEHPTMWRGLPSTKAEFMEQIGYRDIGAVAFALPMKTGSREQRSTELGEMKLKSARSSLRCVFRNFASRCEPGHELDLQCDINASIMLEDALRMAEEEPEMWEELDLSSDDASAEIMPSVHAAAALNSFLWKHTGGWRNTFA